MEIYELRYFAAVAKTENIHQAAQEIHVSAPSLSKAISRLEEELSVKLFHRKGRGIHLSEAGYRLRTRANEILLLEEATRVEISGHLSQLKVFIAGPEILLAKYSGVLINSVHHSAKHAEFSFLSRDEESALKLVENGEAHFAFLTTDIKNDAGKKIHYKNLAHCEFVTCISKHHRLYSKAKKGLSIDINEILEYDFVSPNSPLLGQTGKLQSLDGWRDDQFPRKIRYQCTSLSQIYDLVESGLAMAYLPDYFGERHDFITLKITGCPYSCRQKIKLVHQSPTELRWIRPVVKEALASLI